MKTYIINFRISPKWIQINMRLKWGKKQLIKYFEGHKRSKLYKND